MNQILQVEENRKNSSVDIKKIVLFFAIAIIIFGIILLGQGAYAVYQKNANAKINPNTPQSGNEQPKEYIPVITLTKTEDDKLIINIESEITISHIIYNWNNEASTTIDENGKTYIEETINIPAGENVLNLSVIDSNGKETKRTENYVVETSKPVIELSVAGNDIKITVTSEADLTYVSYRWNLEEEKREDMSTYENRNEFEKTVSIPKGQNTLYITAIDVNNNTTEKSQEIKGVTKAKTEVIAKEGYLDFTVIGEDNIKTVQFELNNKKYLMNTDTFGETKVVHYKVKMEEGWNYLKIISTTQSGAEDTSIWKYEYKAK